MKQDTLNSCMYRASVMHHRILPKKHQFKYDIFMFYLDLAELDVITAKFKWLSYNRFNLFNFRDNDHMQLPREKPDKSKSTREHITRFLSENGVEIGIGKIMLLTNLCTLGYQFNPVCFYFCFDENDNPVCSVAEICNTYKEIKLYFMGAETFNKDHFHLYTFKKFYVSPFTELDNYFDFNLKIPQENLNIAVNDHNELGKLFFLSKLFGKREELTDRNMIRYFFSIPLITIKITFLIHWQAFKLWSKKIKYYKKANNPELQTEVFRPYKS
ncbi:DUF1365 domain-containing protein [Dyadobacter frigoris]|uniref:DUF1365 domain-containing protein n=1 Tax=Dyadobacter frigoris TaxID=2576211 RepID=A0A4U6CUQ8_9BACT|nr:DUF1365 domain-containing protein [Dyadobacter frigoris]TKT87465.1 DUF1365 domain-containing protein [Dyadobacter frigoris]GLU52283.1 DUF1365 domain-containing protein [Dyadobacter frigoris]